MVDAMKPDGWHTYHICGGLIRELTRVADDYENASLMCVVCGQWFDWTVTDGKPVEILA